MSGPTRREALAGGAGALATAAARPPAGASAELDAGLRAPAAFSVEGPWRLADELAEAAKARRREPAAQRAWLRGLTGPLSPAAALDRDVVAAHWTLQARLGREFPIGAGAWRPGTHRGHRRPLPQRPAPPRRNADGET